MPLFKRKEQVLIPPVSGPTTINPSPRQGHANTYVRSRDGDLYNLPGNKSTVSTPGDANALRDKYNRSNGVGDAYSRGGADLDKDRRELFSGYDPRAAKPNQFAGGLGDSEGNDEDIEGIKSQTRFVKQDSVNTTRNALRLAREAEEVARNTLTKLGDQSGKMDGFSMILPCLTVH